MPHLVRSKRKNGTGKLECHTIMQMVAEPIIPVMDCLQVTQDMVNADFVRKFMQKLRDYRIWTKLLLMDREYYSTGIINLITYKRYKFLVPAPRKSTIKKSIMEHHDGTGDGGAVSRQTIKNAEGKIAFTLIITPSKKNDDEDAEILERYHVFATNLSAEALRVLKTLPEYYGMR